MSAVRRKQIDALVVRTEESRADFQCDPAEALRVPLTATVSCAKGGVSVSRPKDVLFQGVRILERVLVPKGFLFQFGDEGRGSGGEFAWGEFVRGDRRIELHFRHSLGLVRYHLGGQSASHESYMRGLGIWDQCRYPGFSNDPLSAFHGLAHDLSLAQDFLSGSAAILQQVANSEAIIDANLSKDLMAGCVDDKRKLDQLRTCFREGRYDEVVTLAGELKYSDRMTESEQRMVEIALKMSSR